MLKRFTALCLAGLFCCAGASAQDWYAGVAAGYVSIKSDTSVGDFSGTTGGFKVFGGYRGSGRFGLEVAYADLGSADDTINGFDVEYDASAFTGQVIYSHEASEKLTVFAKGGLIYWQSDFESSGSGMNRSGEDDRTNLTAGLGALFKTGSNIDIRVEVELHDIDNVDQAYVVSLGAVFGIGDKE